MNASERFETLDGLRGVAAVCVVVYHLSIIGAPVVLPHGWLAVDFFFILSGFVMAHSYAEKLRTLPLRTFVGMRLRRILPLSSLGAMLGVSYFVLRWHLQPESLYSLSDILGSAVFNVALLPKPWVTAAPTDSTFPTNTPLWSLSFEVAVNILWAAFLVRRRASLLAVVCVASGLVLAWLVFVHQTGNLGATWPTFFGGALRTIFGFHVGALLWRFRPNTQKSAALPWLTMAILVAVLAVPEGSPALDVALIVVALPALMLLAVHADNHIDRPVFRLLGETSYALYVIHVPALMFLVGMLKRLHVEHLPRYLEPAVVLLCLILSYGLGKFYDEPLRRMLSRRGKGT